MRTRDTSRKSYEELLESGFLETRRGQVYDVLHSLGPMTQAEVAIEIIKQNPKIDRPSITPRFAELEKLGLIKATSKRRCSVTSKTALVWEADPENRLISIKQQSLRDRIKDLESALKRVGQAKTIKEVRQIVGLAIEDYAPPVLRLSPNAITDIFE